MAKMNVHKCPITCTHVAFMDILFLFKKPAYLCQPDSYLFWHMDCF